MKKIYLTAFAALCAAIMVSCSKDNLVPGGNDPKGPDSFLNPVTLTFDSGAFSKVIIDDKGKASWEEGDQITIVSFDAEGTARKTGPVTVDKETGTFTATVETSDTYYAVYPSTDAEAGEILLKKKDGVSDSLVVRIAATQDGTFRNACYYAAKTSKEDRTFNFKAVSGILKFSASSAYNRVDVRNVESTSETHAFTGVAACSFDDSGNLTVTPNAKLSSTHIVTLDGSGTYYVGIVGNAINEVTFRFSKDGGETYEPGVFYNNRITYVPGEVKNFKNLTDKIVTDVYVSVDGTGDGRSVENPAPASDLVYSCLGDATVKYTAVKGLYKYTGIWNCYRLDGLTVHFAAGEYTDAMTVAGNNAPFVTTLQGEDGAILKGGLTVSATNDGTVTNMKGLTFTAATGLTVTTGKCEVEGCTFTGCTTRAISVGRAGSTDANTIANFRNCLFSANTTSSYGVVNVPDAAAGGILGFHNCRFENNVAAKGPGSAVYTTKGKTAIFLNKCTFIGNKCTSAANAFTIGGNNVVTRIAMNGCTVNAGSVTAYSNGSSVMFKGQGVIVNSTVWTSSNFGKWGLVALGCSTTGGQANGAALINSVIRQKGTTYPAVYLHTDYYQTMNSCLHSGADLTVVEGKHTLANTEKVSSFSGATSNTKTVDGIVAYYYTWDYATTVSGTSFAKPSASEVRAAVSAVGETSTGAADGIGGLFLSWLDGIDADWLSKDLIGTSRPEAGICPGSVEN